MLPTEYQQFIHLSRIEDIIGEEMRRNPLNSISNNSYIFDTKLVLGRKE